MPKVSIIIPVYNGANYLYEAIASALGQDYPDKEVIVVNDGSIDNTAKVINHFGDNIVALNQANQGLGASRNTGINAATGDYFAFLDHDDLWHCKKLTQQIAHMQMHCHEDPLLFTQVEQFICPTLTQAEAGAIRVNTRPMPGYIAGTLLISKARLSQIGPFVEKKQLGEFVEWYLRAVEQNVPAKMMNTVTLRRRVHTQNMGRQHDLYSRTDYLKILKASLDRRRAAVS